MCTVITYKTKDHYFGRTLDYERSYEESVVVTPRKFPLHFRKVSDIKEHYAMIGMATIVNDYPLYYEATNEVGLNFNMGEAAVASLVLFVLAGTVTALQFVLQGRRVNYDV